MAVGQNGLETISSNNDRIRVKIDDIHDCWNTFQYVTKHLQDWADETVIGASMKANAEKYTALLLRLEGEVKKLTNDLDAFVKEQTIINNGI